MARRGISTADINPRYLPQIHAQLGKSSIAEKPKPTIQQNRKGLNKLESEFFEWLKRTYSQARVTPHGIKLRIGNGCYYTPDFLVDLSTSKTPQVLIYETKGKQVWDDSIVKLKAAASVYPFLKFHLVTRRGRTAPWDILEVLS